MEKSNLLNKVISGVLIILLLGINLFFVYKITYHKDNKELLFEEREAINDNIIKFKDIDKELDTQVEKIKGKDINKSDTATLEDQIKVQKSIYIEIENMGKDSSFRKDIDTITSFMKTDISINSLIIGELIENNEGKVEEYLARKDEIINSIDKSYIGLYNDMDKIIKPIDREDVSEENVANLILGQWNDEINQRTYYFNKDNSVYIIDKKGQNKLIYEFISYEDDVFKIVIKDTKDNIEKNILLNDNNNRAKVKNGSGKGDLAYWSYIDSKQEP